MVDLVVIDEFGRELGFDGFKEFNLVKGSITVVEGLGGV